jgi:hypothetical protein
MSFQAARLRKSLYRPAVSPSADVVCPVCGSIAFVALQLGDKDIAPAVDEIPESMVKEHRIIPLRRRGRTLFIVAADVKDSEFVGALSYILDCEVCLVMGDASEIEEVIRRIYP